MPVDLSLLQPTDILYDSKAFTVRARLRDDGWYDVSWNGNRPSRQHASTVTRLYTPHHPKPPYERFWWANPEGYKRAVEKAKETAAASRKLWAERRKAKRAAEKAAAKEAT